MNNLLLIVVFLLFLPGCSENDDNNETDNQVVMFPNYLVINAPSKDPDMQWYVSDFSMRKKQWILETTVDLRSLKLGMYELTQYPNEEPTQAQKEAADQLIRESFNAVKRYGWLSKEKALSDGYEKMYGDPVHFVNKEYVFDGETLNPDKPEVLMYYKSSQGEYLLGVMYLAIGQRGPQVAGPLSEWHYHIDPRMCYERGVLPIASIDESGSCPAGFPNIRSPEMLHVWFFDHPDGRFATTMWLSEEQLKTGVEQIRGL